MVCMPTARLPVLYVAGGAPPPGLSVPWAMLVEPSEKDTPRVGWGGGVGGWVGDRAEPGRELGGEQGRAQPGLGRGEARGPAVDEGWSGLRDCKRHLGWLKAGPRPGSGWRYSRWRGSGRLWFS